MNIALRNTFGPGFQNFAALSATLGNIANSSLLTALSDINFSLALSYSYLLQLSSKLLTIWEQ